MENIVNKVKQNRSLVLWVFAALLVGLVLGTWLGGGSVGGLKSSYLGDDSITCTRTCPDGSTIDANDSCPDNQICTNGASNYPACDDTGGTNTCTNGASNYPACDDTGGTNTCTNGASNYPACDDNIIPGCTDPKASNYNPNANVSDDSCEFYNCKNEEEQVQWNRDNIKTYQDNIDQLRQEQEANKNSWSTTIFGDDTEERIQEQERKIKVNEEQLKELESELETCRKEGINSNRE